MSMSQIVAQAWEDVQKEQQRRDDLQITTLVDLNRARNGVWMDRAWEHPRPLRSLFLLRAWEQYSDVSADALFQPVVLEN